MSPQIEDTTRLGEAFRAQSPTAAEEAAAPPAEEIWDAVHGRLSAQRTREIVHLAAENPAVAETWRLAAAVGEEGEARESDEELVTRAPASRSWVTTSWVLAAALLLAVAGLRWIVPQVDLNGNHATLRGDLQGGEALQPLVEDGTVLPREAFRLSWTPGPEGSIYDLQLRTEALEPVAEILDLSSPEALVEPEALSRLEDGTLLLWQVSLRRADGGRELSTTWSVILAGASDE